MGTDKRAPGFLLAFSLIFRVAGGPIEILAGSRLPGVNPLSFQPPASPIDTGAHEMLVALERTVWAAVCSSGEVSFFLGPQYAEREEMLEGAVEEITVVNRVFLSSWLAGKDHHVQQTLNPGLMKLSPMLVAGSFGKEAMHVNYDLASTFRAVHTRRSL